MQEIVKNVYMEDQFLGVTLGAIDLPHGLVLVDAPPAPEDGRAWRATLLSLGSSSERLLVNLDAHPDRTLGARAMECMVVSHEKAAQVFRSRPNTFKSQGLETGADWEKIPGLGNIRWVIPEISFSQQMMIEWGDAPVVIMHQPGPNAGACWVSLPALKVVFIGDAVMRSQPPFLAWADIPAWLESIKLLLTPAYRGYTLVASRGGLIGVEHVRAQVDFLGHLLTRLEKMAARQASIEMLDNLIPNLLAGIKFPASHQNQYQQRLRYGLHHYYVRHYHPTTSIQGEE